MQRKLVSEFERFSDLPLGEFDRQNISVYVLDLNWNYIYVNRFVTTNLGDRAISLIGKNMWDQFQLLKSDLFFATLKSKLEQGIPYAGITISPLTGQRLNVTAFPLQDCYYCTSSIIPNKDELLNDLRNQLSKTNSL